MFSGCKGYKRLYKLVLANLAYADFHLLSSESLKSNAMTTRAIFVLPYTVVAV